jgi:hypothetical protein
MKWKTHDCFLAAAVLAVCFGSSALAQSRNSRDEKRDTTEPQSGTSESIDTVLRFLNVALDPSLNCDVQEYFGPERVASR